MYNIKLLNYNKTKAVSLTILLLLALAIPLFALPAANASATLSIDKSSGPNGTAVKLTGTGFGPGEDRTDFTVLVDGLANKVYLTGVGLDPSAEIVTGDPWGNLSGYIIIGGTAGNLAPGAHSIQIYDAVGTPPAVTFTVTRPTVTLTPSTGPAGTSVKVTASNFPVSITGKYTCTNTITDAMFSETPITVAAAAFTSDPTELSSNVISQTTGSAGTYTGTVSLPMLDTGTDFTLTDDWGNTGIAIFTLNTPTVTITPTSGTIGTLVTATLSGFGPGAIFDWPWITPEQVMFGETAVGVYDSMTVTEQGTCIVQFIADPGATVDAVYGAHTVTFTDSLMNTATATFTVTPTVSLTLGNTADGDSETTYVGPAATPAKLFLTASGFKPDTLLTFTRSPGVPANWVTFAGAPDDITTDDNGAIAVPVTSTLNNAPPVGVYSVTVSDGTTSIVVYLTVKNSGTFFILEETSGATGSFIEVTGFGAATTSTEIYYDGVDRSVNDLTTQAWPLTPTSWGVFQVPSSSAGSHTITTENHGGSATFTKTGTPVITVVSPSNAAAGTTVTVLGTGFGNDADLSAFTIDGLSVDASLDYYFEWGTPYGGNFWATFAMPAFVTTTHTIVVSDDSYNTVSTSASSTTPTIAVSPNYGTLGAAKSISITGSEFAADTAITVTFDSTGLGDANPGLRHTNMNGGIIVYTTSIAAAIIPAGAHTITVTVGDVAATATFTVNPIITVFAPTAVRPGTTVAITGRGFTAGSALSMTLNGTATTWYNTATHANTTTITADATTGAIPATAAVIVTSATVPQALNISISDTAGFVASKILTVLDTPRITLEKTQALAALGTVAINGTGFSPGTPVATGKLMNGTTIVTALTVTTPVTVGTGGTFAYTDGFTFNVPDVAAGAYTVQYTLGTAPNTETASTAFTILGAASVTPSATQGKVGDNITLAVIGETTINTATLGGALADLNAVPGTTFGPLASPTTGADAYNLTTWFIVPEVPAGSYTVLISDGTRSATVLFTIVPSAAVTSTDGLKGTAADVAGNGFAPNHAFNVTLNGAIVYNSALHAGVHTDAAGVLPAVAFTIPATATLNNTMVVTDGTNSATTYLALNQPTLLVTPASGVAGSTVQLIGDGFVAASPILIQIGGAVVTTAPIGVTGASFIAYVTIPSTTVAGDTVVTATDAKNNAASATFTVTSGGTTGYTVNQAALSSTAQSVNPSTGAAQTSFARGTQVKFTFVLQTSTGSGSTVWRITLQQSDLSVLNIVTTTASVNTNPSTLAYTQLLPAGSLAGTWTANIQVFASDGLTPLAVATVTFTVT